MDIATLSRTAGFKLDSGTESTLAGLFMRSVERFPERPAIVSDAGTLSYREVAERAKTVARALAAQGVGEGSFVGLWMPRGVDVLIAQIAITLTGAAWVPFDADAPPERISECLEDIAATGLVTAPCWQDRFVNPPRMLSRDLADSASTELLAPSNGAAPAYVIYTSGSTGKPKGILVTQSNICHFLYAAAHEYQMTEHDRMLQSASVAFDLSMEEIWVPLCAGAALIVCPAATLADPVKLEALIEDERVTALDVVPTLLSLLNADIPSVRLIIVGGEACPESVVQRYATAGRRLVNSYGPSETTVAVTAKRLLPGTPVTIGFPMANTTCYVVDEALNLVQRGTEGELWVGGPQVAAGYIGRSDLTKEKFVPNPFDSDGEDGVLYRTGDAVVMGIDGDLQFKGRVDDQVKLRGFRVELGEIESRLAHAPGISQAAVVEHKAEGFDQLVGFVVCDPEEALDVRGIRAALREQLPPYMVPARIERIDSLPRLAASGKIDRKTLAAMTLAPPDEPLEGVSVAETPTEQAVLDIAARVFPGQRFGPEADFFLDLGGHSLLAAEFVSLARAVPVLEAVSLSDMYEARTLRAIAAKADASAGPAVGVIEGVIDRASPRRRFWCTVAQGAVMPLLVTIMSAPWLAIFISYALISPDNTPWWLDLGIVFTAYSLVNIAIALLVVALKWIVLGRTKPGRYPLWGQYYFRVWLVQRLLTTVHLKWMQNTPVLRGYMLLLGARVGRDALISDFDVGAIDLLDIGAHCSTGAKVVFANAQVEGAWMRVGTITLKDDVSIGSSCVLKEDTVVGEGAELEDLTSLADGARIPAWTRWSGSPAVQVAKLDAADLPAPPAESRVGRALRAFYYFLALALVPGISVVPIVPAFRLMERIDAYVNPLLGIHYLWYMPVIAMVAAAGMIVFTMVLTVACRWLFLPKVKPGRYALTSAFSLRRWGVGLLIECALDTLSSLFATTYMRLWYRAMGSKIGHGTEISTSFAGRYELITLGDNNFIADDVVMGDDELRRGWMTLNTITTGNEVFIGNEAVVPQGCRIASNSLIGVKSRPPESGVVEAGETWFGSPAIRLPVRQRFEAERHLTYAPPRAMVVWRYVYEAFNVCLPVALFITAVTIIMELMAPHFDNGQWPQAIGICVAASMLISVAQMLVAVAYKWLLMGKYQPTVKPMWSWWALRTEATSVMYWGMAGKALFEALRGTVYLPAALRLFGVKCGKGIYLDSADITEFDSVTIEDEVTLNNHACLQTHLYEDRMMKTGTIHVGRGAVIGSGSTVLYNTRIGADAQLGPLTLVMKGESIPARRAFGGAPARPVPASA